MELEKLSLENFRQFRDDEIKFATGDDQSVTVIHGPNGSGKTTLLNSFTWLFYDTVSFDTRPERLASEGAMAAADVGDEVTIAVELTFNHEGQEYEARREVVYEKRTSTDFDGEMVDSNITLRYLDGGTWQERGNPENSLSQILPERLSGLFFFDGEDIEELAGIDNQDRIQEAIQNIMGLTILERATKHLGDAAKRFQDEVEEHGSDELSALIEEKKALEEKRQDLKQKRRDTERNKERTEGEINDIEGMLERLDESAALQEERQQLREQRDDLEAEVDELTADLKQQVSDNGFIPLAMPLLEETADELNEMREKGIIPSELSNSYIESLLESGTCICGRPLEEGTLHYDKVAAMTGEVVEEGVEQSAMRIVGDLTQFSDQESEFFARTDEVISERKEIQDQITELNEKIDDISSELQELETTTESGQTISELEAERESKTKKRDDLVSELGRLEERIEQQTEAINELEGEIDEQRDEREEALLARRRQKAGELVSKQVEEAFEELKDKVREWANDRMKETFAEIASKNMHTKITDDFELKIWQNVGSEQVEVDKSTGERQIASLAFIGSLVAIARDRYESSSDAEYFTGGIYPLVMDSPFGALDMDHRRQVSRIIPKLSNQVTVFATDSQWEGPVAEELGPRAGQEYWLDFQAGEEAGNYPKTTVQTASMSAKGD
jgi:DNA sulfur modification protein DndD